MKKKQEANKNWLVEGVEKLEKEARAKDHGAAVEKSAAFTGEEARPLDSSDPDYVLKLYGEQQQEAEAKAGAKHPGPARTDPFAPFLQGWLGGSPVHGKFFDEFVRKPDASGLTVASASLPVSGAVQSFSNGEPVSFTREASGAPQPNPYLQGLDMPSGQDLKGGQNQPATGPEAWLKPADLSPASLPAAPLPAVRQADSKLQLPPLADEKKYFPQLKKF